MKIQARIFFWLVLLFLTAFSLAPFVWQIMTSIKPSEEIFKIPPTYLPERLSVESYGKVFQVRPFARYLLNSALICLGATMLCILIGASAAYSLARFHLKAGRLVERSFLLIAFFPPTVLVIPLYELVRTAGLMNNPLSLILCYTTLNLPFAIWILTAYFRQIPQELEEAAMVDGFSTWGRLWRVFIPLAAPAIATTAILVFIFSWNEFLLALTFMTRDTARTVPVGIAMLSGVTVYEIPWDMISSAVVIATLPVVAVVLVSQRRIVEGLTAGAVKG